jgi:hypothetical protein
MDGRLGQSEEQELGAEEDRTLVQLGAFVGSTRVRASKEMGGRGATYRPGSMEARLAFLAVEKM